jgi:hypothetical protein
MNNYNYKFKTEMAAGPCMLWTKHCLKFFDTIEFSNPKEFDKIYGNILFAHDQISTWLISCGVGTIKNVNSIMEIKWRSALPTFYTNDWGNVPVTFNTTAIIHPTKSDVYTEDNCRAYFRAKREVPEKQAEHLWKNYLRKLNL